MGQSSATRPAVLIFGLRPERKAATASVAQRSGPDDASDDAQRTSIASRALRKAFLDEGVVDPLPFSTEFPTIARALLDAHIDASAARDPAETDRLKIAAACGASYVVTISYSLSPVAATASDADSLRKSPALEMDALEVKPGKVPTGGKRWHERIQVSDGMLAVDVARRAGASDAVNTAARTLVLRFLGTPALRDLRRRTPSAQLLPKPASPPTTDDSPETDENPTLAAERARSRAETILRDGNTEEGIRALRRAISQNPRSLSMRLALVQAYLQSSRPDRAEDEAQRALLVGSSDDRTARTGLIRLLGETQRSSGDLSAAEETYRQALAVDPKNRDAQLAVGQLLLTRGETDGAAQQFHSILETHPEDRDAAFGLARVFAVRGDFDKALEPLSMSSIGVRERHEFASTIFLETAMRLSTRLTQNRAGFEAEALDKTTFLASVRAQLKRAAALQKLLQSAPPPPNAADLQMNVYKHHLLAASLLLQSLTAIQSFLETQETTSAAQSRLYLGEFFNELREAASQSG